MRYATLIFATVVAACVTEPAELDAHDRPVDGADARPPQDADDPPAGDVPRDTDPAADTDPAPDTDPHAHDTDLPDGPTPPPNDQPQVTLHWTGQHPNSSLSVEVFDPLGRTGWSFGIAETMAGSVGWYGEDCFTGTGSYTLCHPIPGTSIQLDQVASPAAVVEGSTTLLWTNMDLTYYLEAPSGACWVWGHDPTYYAALGCQPLGGGLPAVARRGHCSGMDPADPAPLGGKIALTFDDGPHATVTPAILAKLRARNIPATFFMLGQAASTPSLASIVDDIVDDPLFEIANHSWTHANLANLGAAQVYAEVDDTNAVLESFTGDPIDFFRFPYGDATCAHADAVRDEHGMKIAGWHIDTADWCYATGAQGTCTTSSYWRIPSQYQHDMRGFILDQAVAYDGGVVLFHDIHTWVANTLDDVLDDLQAAGFSFVPLSSMSAFPALNDPDPVDFPWIGESCTPPDDTCWQVEWNAWCEPTTGGQGVCVVPCGSFCVERDGTAPLYCASTGGGQGHCFSRASPLNGSCATVPGTTATTMPRHNGSGSASVCLPPGW